MTINKLLMDFTVDKSNHKIHVKREFAAKLPKVWDAWTTPEILDKWWAPKPYRTETRSMDFSNGGRWLYAMVSPENDKHWCLADYSNIEPHSGYNAYDSFCDPDGNVSKELPRTLWKLSFAESNGNTIVEIELIYDSLADLEKILSLGMREGFSMALGNLDEWLSEN